MTENAEERTAAAGEHVDVLVVDDDESLRSVVAKGLRKAGWAVATVGTAREGVAAARRSTPSVIVMDLMLPDGGGLGAAREIRRCGLRSPVLFVTGLSTPLVERALSPAPVLRKPFTFPQLVGTVRALLEGGWRPRAA